MKDFFFDIAGKGICVRLPCEMKVEYPYSLFQTKKCPGTTVYEYRFVPELPVFFGDVIHSDAHTRVIGTPDAVYCYLCYASSPEKMNKEYCCCVYPRAEAYKSQRGYTVYLSEEYSGNVWAGLIFTTLCLERHIILSGALALHASYIHTQYGAVLFTAPKQTGKSTQARLWLENRGAVTVNGDRAVIRPQHGGVRAYSIPFSGTSGICLNRDYPLRAIVLLSQARENSIERLSGIRAFRAISDNAWLNVWDRELINSAMLIAADAAQECEVYSLACVPDVSAVKMLEEILKNGG